METGVLEIPLYVHDDIKSHSIMCLWALICCSSESGKYMIDVAKFSSFNCE